MNDDNAQLNTSDHDYIIEIRAELKGMRAELKGFSDDTKERLARVEEGKLGKDDFAKFIVDDTKRNDDHERRIRFLERWGWAVWGAVGLVQFVLIAYLMYRQIHPIP